MQIEAVSRILADQSAGRVLLVGLDGSLGQEVEIVTVHAATGALDGYSQAKLRNALIREGGVGNVKIRLHRAADFANAWSSRGFHAAISSQGDRF